MENQQLNQQLTNTDDASQLPLSILLAEDDVTNQYVGLKILNKMGYHADVAENGNKALQMANQKNYEVILMDVRMPEIDGLELTKMLRTTLLKQPIIIAMTANALHGDREMCIEAGMDDYISKPINFQKLAALLEKWAHAIRMPQAS